MSEKFEFQRFDLRACACDECDEPVREFAEFDGDYVRAHAAIEREEANAAKIQRMSTTLAALWPEIVGEPVAPVTGSESFNTTLIACARELIAANARLKSNWDDAEKRARLNHKKAEAARNECEQAMQDACATLPENYLIEVNLERGAGWVEVIHDGERVDFESEADSMTQRIRDAIDYCKEERGNG